MRTTPFKRKLSVFMTSFILSGLSLLLIYGMARVYVTSRNTLQAEKIEILYFTQTGYETAEFSVVGKKYTVPLKPSKGIPPLLYVFLPPEWTLLCSGLDQAAECLETLR